MDPPDANDLLLYLHGSISSRFMEGLAMKMISTLTYDSAQRRGMQRQAAHVMTTKTLADIMLQLEEEGRIFEGEGARIVESLASHVWKFLLVDSTIADRAREFLKSGKEPSGWGSEQAEVSDKWDSIEINDSPEAALLTLQESWDLAWDQTMVHGEMERIVDAEDIQWDRKHPSNKDLLWTLCIISLIDKATYPNGPLEDNEVRILTLQPGLSARPIDCVLENAPLDEAVNDGFAALSYCWGPPNQNRYVIFLNSMPQTIGESLFHALVHIRDSSAPTRYWIDALCIRQDDTHEKTKQLPLMASIYSRAQQVTIWLGPDADDSQWALQAISTGDKSIQSDRRFIKAIQKILERPWFSRLWTVQEFVLSEPNGPWLRSGYHSACWTCFYEAFVKAPTILRQHVDRVITNRSREALESMASDFQTVSAPVSSYFSFMSTCMKSSIWFLQSLRPQRGSSKPGSLPLPLVLMATRRNQATDLRDKIYGLLGMIEPDVARAIQPSYSKTKSVVYRDATLAVLLKYSFLAAYCVFPTASVEGEPSWLLDFSYSESLYVETSLAPTAMSSALRANSGPGPLIRFLDNLSRLQTPATIVDTITSICNHDIDPLNPLSGMRALDEQNPRSAPRESVATQSIDPNYFMRDPVSYRLVSFLIEAGISHRRAISSAQWWAAGQFEPLWMTLTGPLRDGRLPGLSSGDLIRKMKILTATDNNSVPLGSEDASKRAKDAEPLSGSIRIVVAPQSPRGKTVFFTTTNGLCGLSSGTPRVGDEVGVLFRNSGSEIPFVLRSQPDGSYKIVGVASIPANWTSLCAAKGCLEPGEIIIS